MDNIGFDLIDENLPVVRNVKLGHDDCSVAVYRSGSGFPTQVSTCSGVYGAVIPEYGL